MSGCVVEAARRLGADLKTASPRFSVAVVPEGGILSDLREAAARRGHATSSPSSLSISVRFDEQEHMRVVFLEDIDLRRQTIDALDQVQDIVIETIRMKWPPCPEHDHFLIPEDIAEHVVWQCPTTKRPIAAFGDLAGLNSP